MTSSTPIKIGAQVTVLWESNPRGSVLSNKINGEKSPKIVLAAVLPNGPKPQAGETWICEIARITNQKAEKRGAIIVNPIRRTVDTDFGHVWVPEHLREQLVVVMQNRKKHVFLEGMQGVGKTTIAREAARKLGRQFRVVKGSQIKKSTIMYGRPQQQRTPEGGTIWAWTDSQLITFVREALANPHLEFEIFIDEYTRIDEDARDGFLEVLEGDEKERAFTTPRPEVVRVPPNIHWMAAGNVGDTFTVKDQDAANTDRWVVLEIPRMPKQVELLHLQRLYARCPRADLERALEIVHMLIKIIGERMRLSNTISVRQTENMAFLLSEGINIREAMVTAIANQFRGRSADSTSERGRLIAKIDDALKGVNIAAA
jgi:MoxR-like ATPase